MKLIIVLLGATLLAALIYIITSIYKGVRFLLPKKTAGGAWLIAGLGIALLVAVPYLIYGNIITAVIFALYLCLFELLCLILRGILKRTHVWQRHLRLERLYRLMLIPILATALLFAYGSWNMRNVRITPMEVKTTKQLPNGELNIALLSDIHFPLAQNESDIDALVKRLNDKRLDLALLCGDIIDESSTLENMQYIFSALGKLQTRYGVYYVYGNHDRALYRANPNFTSDEISTALLNAGIVALEDISVTPVQGVTLIGRKNRGRPRADTSELIKNVDLSNYIILADHQPVDYKQNAALGVDLMLSGHTHGGQFFPIGYINTLISSNEQCYGQARIGDMTALVSSGVAGWGIPIRTQAHSEVMLVQISNS